MRPLYVSLQRPGTELRLRSRTTGLEHRVLVHDYLPALALLLVVRPWGHKRTEQLSIRLDGSCVQRSDLYLPDPRGAS